MLFVNSFETFHFYLYIWLSILNRFMFFSLLLQILFLEAAPSIIPASKNYAYAGWDTKKRTLVLDIASAASIEDLSKVVTQITGAEATLTPDQFRALQDQMSKAVANADNEDVAKQAVIEVVSAAVQPSSVAAIPEQKKAVLIVSDNVVSLKPSQRVEKQPSQNLRRPSSFQLDKIAAELFKTNKIRELEPQYGAAKPDQHPNILKQWTFKVLHAYLKSQHPLNEDVRFKWRIDQSDVTPMAKMISEIITSENQHSENHMLCYHGMNSMATFLMVMYEAFFQLFLDSGRAPNFSLLRMSSARYHNFTEFFQNPAFAPFIEEHLEKKAIPYVEQTLKWFDNHPEVTTHVMSVSPSILTDAISESPLYFYAQQRSVVLSADLLKMIVGNALRVVGIPEDQIEQSVKRYLDLAQKFAPNIKRAIAQILIRKEITNDVLYLSARGGLPFNFNPEDKTFFSDTFQFLKLFGEGGYPLLATYIQARPELKGTELFQQFVRFKGSQEYWEHGLQMRLLGTSDLFYNPKNLEVKLFTDDATKPMLQELRENLKKLATEDLALAKK